MEAPLRCKNLIEYILIFVMVLFVTGCGGGGSSSGAGTAASSIVVHADAGNIVAVRVNQNSMLDGSASTTSSEPATYSWSFTAKPDGSKAELLNATSVNPGFTADVTGTYRVQLVVSSNGISSQRAIGLVEVTNPGDDLTGKRVHTSYPAQCADCHDGRYANEKPPAVSILAKSGNHTGTSNVCQACHTTFGFSLIRYVDHLEVFGNCSSCHNGVTAIGKSEFHIKTSAECDDCHTTTSFITLGPDGKFDHSGTTDGCARCHNGKTAIGKTATVTHNNTTSDCSYCHTTTSFKDAYVDHSGITDNCASCHNGTDAKGITVGHPVMAVDCSTCHNTTSFNNGGVYNHRVSSAVQSCSSCHTDNNSINARAKSAAANHVTTTADCGVCHGVGGGNFANGIYDHTGIVSNCSACHGAGGNGTGLGKSTNHMPTADDCSVCHTTGTFKTGVYDHNGVNSGCAVCHNNTISVGKLENHIPTNPANQDCVDCHGKVTFKGAVFNHVGIDTSNCALCHDGTISKGKSNNHLSTTRDCSTCHDITKFDNFTGGTFDHLEPSVANNCASCHNGVIAIDKKVDHIPAQTECSQCHTDTTTGGFKTTIFSGTVHPGISTGCEGCHISKFFPALPLVKAAGHLPTSQDCHACHTNVSFAPQIFTHAGIVGNCASCHSGGYVAPAGALGKPGDHPATNSDCGTCHGIGANFIDGIFDHTGRTSNCSECHGDGAVGAVTKKNGGHVTTVQDCSVCHVPGTFKTAVFSHVGIVDNCTSCHDGADAVGTIKSGSHLPTSKDCSVCHNTEAFAGAKYDHTGIVDNCATCHDGNIAKGKLSNHVPTTEDCSVCHLTTGFKPGTFDHVGIVDNCQSCHNGVFAQDKNSGHVVTNQDCGVCHTPNKFKPATYDHSTVSTGTRCDSCHGVTAKGKDAKVNPSHIATNLDCRSCHTTATFVGGTWFHDGSSVGICNTCHSTNGGATPQPTTGHFDTSVQCDSCHNTNGWAPASTFDHCAGQSKSATETCSGSDYPGNHDNKNRSLACTDCHTTNSQTVTYPYPEDTASPPNSLVPACAACHRKKFDSEDKHIGGKNGTVYENRDCSGGGAGCHKVTKNEF